MMICIMSDVFLATEVCLESRMRSGTWRGVSKWSRRKDRYIGQLYSDFGKVPSDSGIYRSTEELREFAWEKCWALLGHTGKRVGLPMAGRAPPQGLVRIGLGRGAAPPPSFPSLFPFLLSYSYYLEGGNPTPGRSRTPQGVP